MSKRIALCLDEETCRNPEIIGLGGESLDAQSWLDVYQDGRNARRAIGEDASVEEAWVVSCDDVDPINLAAALKADRPELRVRLVTSKGCGSLYSRAHTASIDEVIEQRGFLKRYAEAKRLALEPSARSGSLSGGRHGMSAGSESSLLDLVEAPARIAGRQDVKRHGRMPARVLQVDEEPSSLVAHAQRKGFLMPVVSGSGGSGKSSVSTLLAFNAATRGLRTLLVDYDLQFGDIAQLAGVDAPLTIDEVLSRPEKLEREIARSDNLTVLAAPKRLEVAEEIVQELPGFLDWLIKRFDVVAANTGASWAEEHAVLLERSSASVFLVDQRMSSVRACNHALELCARCGIATGSFRFVLNRCVKGAPLSSSDVSNVLQGAPVYELREGGRDVEDCLSGGAVLDLLSSGNDFVSSVDTLLDRVLPFDAFQAVASEGREESSKVVKRRGRHAGRRRGRRSQ